MGAIYKNGIPYGGQGATYDDTAVRGSISVLQTEQTQAQSSISVLQTALSNVQTAMSGKAEQTALESAVDDLQFQINGLGEPFRLQDFNQQINITVPSVSKDIANTDIPNIDIDLDVMDPTGALGTNFAIAGLTKYEVYDATSGGNRLNVFPVASFSMNSQKQLRVRMMCAGANDKAAKRIVGAILLKHR